jgi:hypothetical protein
VGPGEQQDAPNEHHDRLEGQRGAQPQREALLDRPIATGHQ